MSQYGSQKGLNMSRRAGSRGDLSGGMGQQYTRSEIVHGGGNGYDPYMEYNSYNFSKSSGGGMGGGMMSASSGMMGGGGGMMSGGGGMMSGGGGMMSGGMMSSSGGMISGGGGGMMSGGGGGGGMSGSGSIHQRAMVLQAQCQDYLKKAEYALQSGGAPGDAERYMSLAKETIDQLKTCAVDLRQMGQPSDNVLRTLDLCRDQLKGVHMAMTGSMHRRRSTRGSSGGWEEPGRSFQDAMGWIAQQKRLIETASWGDDPAAIDQQLVSHQKFHNSIQRSVEVDRAKEDLVRKGDKGNLHLLEQEWDSLQQMSFGRTDQLQDLKRLIQEMSKEIMWVNDREEEELMFDWGDKNIDQYIPRKQESYSKLMSALEDKEKDLNKLKTKVDSTLKNNHPAADKIEAYQDTLQTQWSWLLQITKCIDTHLKENAAYNQFFKEANETYSILQKEHETVRRKFTCDKNTSLENLLELLRGLEREKEKIKENKRQVHHLVNQSKNIVRLKPRNPEEKSSSPIIVKALCDFKQDQKVICKDNEAILKDNSQRSKWEVTGPGGLDMSVPSVCLLVPPPNPLCVSLASKNEQYYEAILSIWNQLYINVKSMIAWQYCVMDINKINSLTISMLSRMRPEEYRQLIKSLETHYEEFRLNSHGSQMFTDDDKRSIENQFTGAQTHYEQIVVQLPTYIAQQEHIEAQAANQQQFFIIQQQDEMETRRLEEEARMREEEARRLEEERRRAEEARRLEEERRRAEEARRLEEERRRAEEARRLEEERRRAEAKKVKKSEISKTVVKVVKTEPLKRAKASSTFSSSSSSRSLSELHALRLRLEAAEGSLSQHVHICLGDDGIHDCGLKITELESMQRDVSLMRDEYLRLRDRITKELEGMTDSDKAQFLRSEIDIINERLGGLDSISSAYLQRLRALRDLLASVAEAEDIVKVHEARLTEKETTSLSPSEVEDYMLTLKNVKAELDQKKAVLASMEAEFTNASHWNSQVGGTYHRCDIMLSKYNDQVNLLSDRWRRIEGQIDTRLLDLQTYQPQLQHYKQTSTSLIGWIDDTRKKQDTLQATKIESVQALSDHIQNQKALNSEIKAKRETVESVLRENETCVNSIKDYETDLASYTSGLETLLNIPIKRTMLKSPSMDLNLEATQLQTRYMELLTQSGDYYKFLGELQKNMEELKIRNTRIDLLEEELRLLRESMEDRNAKNKSLEDAVARFKLELSTAQDQLLTMEEVKSSTALQNSAARESLDSTQSQLTDLNDEVGRLSYLLEEERRKRRLAEERYTTQQEEYDLVLKKRQKELETVSWSKVEVEKSEATKDHELEQLRRQLAEMAARIKELQKEMSKVRSQCSTEINNIKLSYESQLTVSHTDIQRLSAQREEDTVDLQLQYDRMEAERRNLEEELRRLRMSMNQTEDQLKRAEEEAYSQRAVITEEGRRRRELEGQVEVLMRQRDEEGNRYGEELAEVMQRLQEKSEELTYITHSLEEETRRRRIVEEGKGVLEQSMAKMQVKLTSSSKTANELGDCMEELQKMRLELDRESRERSRIEENMSRLQGRMKDLQEVRDGLESQVENLRKANKEEVSKRRQVETELENTTVAIKEYSNTVTALRQSQEEASMSEKKGGEERFRLQDELERESRERRMIEENMSRLQSRLKELQNARDGLQSQVENLRRANQEEVSKRRQVEQELESTSMAVKEYSTTVTALRQSQEHASMSEKKGGEERLKLQEELDRESRERSIIEQNMSRLQIRMKELQDAKVGLESQVENLRKVNQEELSRRRQVEKELQTTTMTMTEYSTTVTALRQSQEQASMSEKKGGEERLKLQEELERESKERRIIEQNMSSLQIRMKELQNAKVGLESQVENLRKANQDEVSRRRQVEQELQTTTMAMTEYSTTVTALRQSQEQASMSEKRGGEERLKLQEELDRESKERRKIEENMSTLQIRLKEFQDARVGLESQMENLRKANQEEVSRRRQVEKELQTTTKTMTEYSSTITTLRKSQEQASMSEKKGGEERLRLQEELEREGKERRKIEENMSTLQIRLKEFQDARVGLESQMENLRKANQEEVSRRRQVEKELQTTTKTMTEYSSTITTLRKSQEQASMSEKKGGEERLKLQEELDRESKERRKIEENMSRLQIRMKEFQDARVGLESQVENLKKANQEEMSRRRQVEKELQTTTMTMTEYSSTITALRKSQEQASMSEKRGGEERLRLQAELEKSLKQNKTSAERMAQLSAEMKAQQQQLLQEQARVKEANVRNESLYKTIEEKSKTLNEWSVELQKLKEMTETQTKERLRLEEELRATRHDKEELLRSQQGRVDELSSQINALELQLKASERSNADCRNLVSELSSEREKLKLETEQIQKQAIETTAMMQSLQSQYSEIVSERDDLLLKLQLSQKDKDRCQRLEEELSRIKLSQESELRNKQRLQEENDRMKRDSSYWKDQCDSKQNMIRQYDSDKERLEREKNSLKSEIERLMRELRELEEMYKSKLLAMQKDVQEMSVVRKTMESELSRAREPPTLDPSTLVFDGVRKPVTADQLLDCGVLDKPTFSQLVKGQKTVPDVSVDKKVSLKGTGPIAGVVIGVPKGPGSITGPLSKITFAEAKKENLLPPDSVDLLLDAQAATGHIIDPRTNQKLTVEEACDQGVVDEEDRDRLLAAEAAAVGYRGPGSSKPLSVFQAMEKGMIDKNTTLRLLQAQESVGGILDPILSVFLPKDTAIERKLVNDEVCRALNKRPELYLDPDSEEGVTYMSMKRRCKVEPHTGLLLLPIPEKVDPSKLVFDGVRKPVTAKQLLECDVLDKPTFKDLEKGKKTVPEVSEDKNVNLKGTGPIAGVLAGSKGKMSLTEAKKQMLLPEESADLLLEAQAATGHIIDPKANKKLTVEEACAKGVVDINDRDKLLAAEAAAVGYRDPSARKPLSVFEAMKKGSVDKKTALRLLQAQESVGGILDPNLSVFLPKDTAIKRKLLDENLRQALKQSPECYLDPETERDASYGTLKKRCKTEPHTGLLLLPITEKLDPSKLIFDGVRKPVTAKELLDCGVLDKQTLNQLMKGEKTVPEVSEDKKVPLKGMGSIAGVAAGPLGKMALAEAKKQLLMTPESADLLLDAQAATGHIIDPTSNEKLTVEEACARGVVDNRDRDRLLGAEAAAVGYQDPSTRKPLSVFEAMKKGSVDKKTALRLLQAQESAGGILDPNLSVFLPKDTAIKRNLLDEELSRALKQSPACYLDPDTERNVSYDTLKKKSKTESHTGLIILPITERKDPSKLMFDGIRKPVSAQELFECGVLDKPTFDQLVKGEKTVPAVSKEKMVYLKGTGPIAAVVAGRSGKMSLSEAKKQMIMPPDSAVLLLEAQAATGHIIDPETNQKLTVEEACAKGVVDIRDRDRLLAAEAAAVGYKDHSSAKPLSVFEAMKKGSVDKKTALRLLQAQESAGGIVDPNLSVFLPKDTAIKRNLLDEELSRALKQSPACYLDPDTELEVSYETLKKRSKTESHTGLIILPITERKDPSKLVFDGIRKPVSAQELFECGVLDKPTFDQLVKGEKTVPAVSKEKMVYLKGTGPIAAVGAGPQGKMSLSEAKKQMIMPPDSADLLLEAQAATGHIIDPETNQKLTVEEACSKGVVDIRDRDRLLAAEAAAVGYKDRSSAKPLSVFEAMKKGSVDKKTALRLLQAQESAGGIVDPNLSVFLPKDTAIKRNLLNEELSRALKQSPACYLDPDTELEASYETLKKRSKTESHTGLIILPITERKDPSKLVFDGIRKPVSAQELFECGVLDKPTFDQLVKGEKTVPAVSKEKMVYLKGTGPIAAVGAGPQGKMSLSEAKKQMIMPPESADLLLEAQAATGHIIDPETNQKLTVEEACSKGVVDIRDRDRLLAAEAAAVGYKDRSSAKPLSVFEAMKKGSVDKKTALRLLQAQESAGGIVDPNLSVFLPKEIAIKRNLLNEELSRALKQSPACYLDPDTEREASYETLKKRSKTESHTGLIILPITERKDPSKLVFDGIRKPVSAQELFECGVLDKPTFDQLVKGEKTVPAVSKEKMVYLKGTGPIAAVGAGPQGKMSLSEAKKQRIIPPESADLLLEAQAATGHIIDPETNQKLTVEEACSKGVVDIRDRDRLLAAEAAAVGYKDRSSAKPLSVFEAMKKGSVDKKTALRLLQAQESAGGILDPNLSVFLPKDTAIKRYLLDEELSRALKQSPACYLDPDTEREASYETLKKRSKTESHTGLVILPVTERKDPSKLVFDGIRKPVSAQELFESGVLDKPTFDQLVKGEKTVPAVSKEKMVYLKGTGPIAAVGAGPRGKMSLSEAKKQMIMPPDSADLLLEAQAATGHIIDPETNQKLTVEEACSRGVVDIRDRDRLLVAEAAAVGYKDRSSAKPLSVFEAMKKGSVDKKTALRLLQAQESAGGILDPNLSVFLPKDTAIKRNLLDEELSRALKQSPACYLDPDTEREASYETLKKRSKTESHTGLIILPVTERKDPSKLVFDGIRKPVSAQELFECGVLDKPTFDQLLRGEKTVPAVSKEKMVYLKGTGPIGGVVAGPQGKMSLSEAKKQMIIPPDSADLLLEAQAATGYIIDPSTNQRLTVEEACAKGVVDIRDRDRLLTAEAAAVGYKDPSTGKRLSVFEATKKGLVDKKTALRLLQAQESAGGIIDPNLSVFLPKEKAIKRNLLDENLRQTLNQNPACYLDPDTERDASYGALKEKCKTEPQASLQLLPVSERIDPSKLLFEGVRKTVTAQQLVDCGVLDKPTFNQLKKGEKTVPEVSVDKKVFLKGTGSISGVAAGPLGKMSFTEAKKQKIMSPASADMLLEAQAATGIIMDPRTNQKLTVKEACARGVVDRGDESKLFAAEAAALGYKDPNSGKLLSVGQAMKKGLIDRDTALRVLQAQESVGGILDPALGIFLPKDTAMDRDLIDEDLYRALNQSPECYLDPDTQQPTTYISLKKKCKADPSTGLLLLPEPKKPITFQGLRNHVSVIDLVDANLLDQSDMNKLREGRLTSKDIEDRLGCYLRGSTCIAGVHDEVSDKVMSVYQAMKEGLLQPGTTLELLEAQAVSGFIIDPVNNQYLTVSDAYNKRLFGPEFKDNLLSAERAVTGYKLPGTDKVISLFQAIERGLVEKGHGIRLLEAQIASGGIIDPEHSHRIDVNVAYKRGYFDEAMNKILTDPNVNTKGFFDPNTEENLTYLELKDRCIKDRKTGLILLPIMDKKKLESTLKNTLRKRRVIIVDPETNKEMTVRVAYDKGLIDYDTYKELSEQECEWEEITITAPDGSVRFLIIDKRSGKEYDITELLERGVINQSDLDRYRSRAITLTEFADIIGHKTKPGSSSSTSRSSAAAGASSVTSSSGSRTSASPGASSMTLSTSRTSGSQGTSSGISSTSTTSRTSGSPGTSSVISSSSTTSSTSASPGTPSVTSTSILRTSEHGSSSSSSNSSSVHSRSLSPTLAKMTTTRITTVTEKSSRFSSGEQDSPDSLRGISSVSITLASPAETVGEQAPVGAIFDTDTIEKITITEALNRDLLDSITAQRLLEAQACTGGIINPTNGQRLSIQEAARLGIIDDVMAPRLKPAQKAFFGFEDVKNRKKMSAAQAMKEMWLPYEAGQRFLEYQYVTGGLYDPEIGGRRTLEDAVRMGWLDERSAQKLRDVRHHTKNLTCPKSKLKISYKEALDNCMVEEGHGVKMLQASSVSSKGISSPYNVSSAPGSSTGSRSGSRRSSRRSSVDLGSPTSSSTSRYSHTTTSFSSTSTQ